MSQVAGSDPLALLEWEVAGATGRRVAVRRGRVPDRPTAPSASGRYWAIQDGTFWFEVLGVARFFVPADGGSVLVDPEPGAPPALVHRLLLGAPTGFLVHRGGRLPLHASCVAIDGSAMAFAGRSGAGKSSLAAHLQWRGHTLLADDTTVIAAPRDEPRVEATASQLRLCEDTLQAHGLGTDGFVRDPIRAHKLQVPVPAPHGPRPPYPLVEVCFLDRSASARAAAFETLSRHTAAARLAEVTFWRKFLPLPGGRRAHLETCDALSRRVRVSVLHFPPALMRIADLASAVETRTRASANAGP